MGIYLMDLDAIRANKVFLQERVAFLKATAERRLEMREANLLEQSLFSRYFSDSRLSLNLEVSSSDYLSGNVTNYHTLS